MTGIGSIGKAPVPWNKTSRPLHGGPPTTGPGLLDGLRFGAGQSRPTPETSKAITQSGLDIILRSSSCYPTIEIDFHLLLYHGSFMVL